MSIQLTIVGNVGQDPQQRMVNTANGPQKVTNFSVASNNPRQANVEPVWYRVAVWGTYGDTLMQYVRRGSRVTVFADDLKASGWVGNDGQQRISLDVRAQSVHFDTRSGNMAATGTQDYMAYDEPMGDIPF